MQDQLILNRYRPISEAGSGGFATVQLAWDTRIQRRVAIKTIKLDERAVAGLEPIPGLDEARTAAMLNDASIVGVYDFEVQGSKAYLIMEYVDGLTLTQLMEDFGDILSLDAIAAVFSSVAHALEVAHENQVLHLDIKPDNVLINRQGQVKVTDFGLATLSDERGFGAAGGGTIGYMPLEQMRQESLDVRCDEWALASMAYEMLTDENPFLAPDLGHAEAAILDAELVLPSLCFDGLDPQADDVLFYALDPDREERYANIADFAEEMEKFLGNPKKGTKELASLVGEACEDFEEEEESAERVSFFDRLGGRGAGALSRVWSVLSTGLLGVVALGHIPLTGGWTSFVFWGLLALVVVAAALKPHLGTFLAFLALVVALFFGQAYLVGVLLAIALPFWWFFVGRLGNDQANTVLAPALFGSFSFNQITPLAIGFFLDIRDTLLNTLMAVFLSLILASLGSRSLMGWNSLEFWAFAPTDIQANMLILLQQPLTWCIIASWFLAALAMSLFCLRQTRLFAAFGALVGTALLLTGLFFGSWFASGMTDWLPDPYLILVTSAAGIVMLVACALGVPNRLSDVD